MDKSIDAAIDAAFEYARAHGFGAYATPDMVRAAIAAYRDAEIERLTAANQAARIMADFAKGLILDALNSEDGMDGDAGGAVCQIITEWQEHGTFDQTECGWLTSAERRASEAVDEDAAAEIERLKEHIKTLLANHQNVRAKLEAAELDAERYRWLADGWYCLAERNGVAYMHVNLVPDGEDKESLDAAIDAARGGERG